MALTPAQLQHLNDIINTVGIDKIINYINNGMITLDDIPKLDEERREAIRARLAASPNAVEQQEWSEVNSNKNEPLESRKTRLTNYINRWKAINPPQNHVGEAEVMLAEIYKTIEADQWNNIDPLDVNSLYFYLEKFPYTSHKAELDDMIWGCIETLNQQDVLQRYLAAFPEGNHSAAARSILDNYKEWEEVESCEDIFRVYEFMIKHENDAFRSRAHSRFDTLKRRELDDMKTRGTLYSIDRLSKMIKSDIVTKDELIYYKICTQKVLDTLQQYDYIKRGLPDIATEMSKCQLQNSPDRTDVYLFGIPSTGKSCILMGLMGARQMNVNYVRNGGPYAAALKQYLDVGITIPRTETAVVATLMSTIYGDNNTTNEINLVEMAGEDFAFKLADNPDSKVALGDMGEGVPELLSNTNRKAFFLIVDPTTTTVRISRNIKVLDENGNFVGYRTQEGVVSQPITLAKMVDILSDPENEEIMKRVDALHIIVTKADEFGDNRPDRLNGAFSTFMATYGHIVMPLVELCKKYDINQATGGVPMVYAFSLGKFYVGGIYEYDPSDANMLVKVMQANSVATKKENLWNKIQKFMNKPII
jgi:hypothetical protein